MDLKIKATVSDHKNFRMKKNFQVNRFGLRIISSMYPENLYFFKK